MDLNPLTFVLIFPSHCSHLNYKQYKRPHQFVIEVALGSENKSQLPHHLHAAYALNGIHLCGPRSLICKGEG